MNRNQLFEAIGEVDEELLEQSQKKVIPWYRWAGAAAACLVLFSAFGIWKLRTPAATESPAYSIPSAAKAEDMPEQAAPGDCGEAPAAEALEPEAPPIEFKALTEDSEARCYDIALPEGYFFHDMTPEEMGSMFGLEWLDNLAGYPLIGSVIYDGNGDAWSVTLFTEEGTDFCAEFSPDHLPFECVDVRDKGFVIDYYGVPLTAFEMNGRYEISALYEGGETVGFRARCSDKAPLEALAYQIAVESHDLKLSPLHTDEVPAWRNERMDEATARKEEGFAPYIPTVVPARFTFNMGYRELGQDRDYLILDYNGDDQQFYGFMSVHIQKIYEDVPIIDPENRISYDRSDYYASGLVPDEYYDTWSFGAFRASDLTEDLVASRCRIDPDGVFDCDLHILYDDGTLVSIMGGLTAEEAWQIVSQLPKN